MLEKEDVYLEISQALGNYLVIEKDLTTFEKFSTFVPKDKPISKPAWVLHLKAVRKILILKRKIYEKAWEKDNSLMYGNVTNSKPCSDTISYLTGKIWNEFEEHPEWKE